MVAVYSCRAQATCNIKKAYAFFTVSVPGVQMADENGNPIPPKPNITRFIYVEAVGGIKPPVTDVLYNNNELAATITAVKEKAIIAGSELSENNNFTITAKKGNCLWKIDVVPKAGEAMPGIDCKNIIIRLKVKGKTCLIKIDKETQLAVLPRY